MTGSNGERRIGIAAGLLKLPHVFPVFISEENMRGLERAAAREGMTVDELVAQWLREREGK
jgi:hypothetical protein